MESKMEQRNVVQNKVKKGKFYTRISRYHTEFEIIVYDGRIHFAGYYGPKDNYEWNGYDELTETSEKNLRYIIEKIIFAEGAEKLKELYDMLDDERVKKVIKSIQQELLQKLTF